MSIWPSSMDDEPVEPVEPVCMIHFDAPPGADSVYIQSGQQLSAQEWGLIVSREFGWESEKLPNGDTRYWLVLHVIRPSAKNRQLARNVLFREIDRKEQAFDIRWAADNDDGDDDNAKEGS